MNEADVKRYVATVRHAVREIRHISREPRVWDICDRVLTKHEGE